MNKPFPTYVVHYTKNIQRKLLLDTIFNIENFTNVNYICAYDREDLTYIDYFNNFKADFIEYQKRNHRFFSPHYPLTPPEISCALKHKQVLKNFVKTGQGYCLLLEDDNILETEFLNKFDKYFSEIPKDFGVGFIGQGAGKRIDSSLIKENQYWYKKEYPADRCGDSIIFTKSAAELILNHIEEHKICFPIDHEYAFWFEILKIPVYWLEPPLTVQGSQIGLFHSIQDDYNTNSKFEDKTLPVRADITKIMDTLK